MVIILGNKLLSPAERKQHYSIWGKSLIVTGAIMIVLELWICYTSPLVLTSTRRVHQVAVVLQLLFRSSFSTLLTGGLAYLSFAFVLCLT